MEEVNEQAARHNPSPSTGTAGMKQSLPPPQKATPLDELEQHQDPLSGIKRLIQQNQTAAVLGGFALGVFMGLLMRG